MLLPLRHLTCIHVKLTCCQRIQVTKMYRIALNMLPEERAGFLVTETLAAMCKQVSLPAVSRQLPDLHGAMPSTHSFSKPACSKVYMNKQQRHVAVTAVKQPTIIIPFTLQYVPGSRGWISSSSPAASPRSSSSTESAVSLRSDFSAEEREAHLAFGRAQRQQEAQQLHANMAAADAAQRAAAEAAAAEKGMSLQEYIEALESSSLPVPKEQQEQGAAAAAGEASHEDDWDWLLENDPEFAALAAGLVSRA